jgi:hypothetical protein
MSATVPAIRKLAQFGEKADPIFKGQLDPAFMLEEDVRQREEKTAETFQEETTRLREAASAKEEATKSLAERKREEIKKGRRQRGRASTVLRPIVGDDLAGGTARVTLGS